MIEVYTGNPGSGKTTYLARQAVKCLKANQYLFSKHNVMRKVRSNIIFSKHIHDQYCTDTFPNAIEYYEDLADVDSLRNCDLIIDEISLFFDSHNWEALPRRTKKFLRLHRHYGVNIYGASQDFKSIDPSFRRLVDQSNLYYFDRITASKEPDPNIPEDFIPYLFTIKRRVHPLSFNDEKIEYRYSGLRPHIFLKKDFNVFDTHQEFELGAINESTPGHPDLKKIVQVCKEDGFTKVSYKPTYQ